MITDKAIILCAGEGKRLRPLTYNIPKCLAEVNEIPILINAIKIFSKKGIKEVILVVGHLSTVIKEKIGDNFEGVKIKYIENNIYKDTNSMYSLLLGLNEIKTSTWLLEGDVFLSQQILDLPCSGEISWFADSSTKEFDGAYLKSDNSLKINSLQIIRNNESKENLYKSIGLVYLSKAGVEKAKAWLSDGVKNGRENQYYDLIFADKFNDIEFDLVDVCGKKWYEIDSMEDLNKAKELFK